MHILIVGAGAVGQTYGLHFSQGGASVSFLVKPHHDIPDSLPLWQHGMIRKRLQPKILSGFSVYRDLDDLPSDIDQVWLTMASDALGAEWLMALKSAVPENTAVFGLQPGLKDDGLLADIFGERALKGVIGFLAYQSPLPGREGPEGIAYLLPPTAGAIGPKEHPAVQIAQRILREGGMKVSRSGELQQTYGRASALSITHMAALEVGGWTFKGFRSKDVKALASEASDEALRIVDRYQGREPAENSMFVAGLGPMISRLASLFIALPLETYLQYHFTKVGNQTREMLDTYIELGRSYNMKVSALLVLRERLGKE